MSPIKAREKIREAAVRVLKRVDEAKPVSVKKPFTLKVEYIEAKYAEDKLSLPGVKRLNDTTITKLCNSLDDVVF